MDMSDAILFENIEKFIQNIDWGKTEVPNEVICLIKTNNSFKTKDLDNSASDYMVSFEGSLKSQYFEEYEYVSDNDKPMRSAIKTKGEYWIDECFSGKMNIFSDTYIDFSNKDWYVLFELSFINGFLVKSKCVKCTQSDNIHRKTNQNDTKECFINECEHKQHFLCNTFIKIYINYYARPTMWLVSKLTNKFPKFKKALLDIFVPFNRLF